MMTGNNAKSNAATVFHYTTGNKLPLIADAGALLPKGVAFAPAERPVLWFSTRQDYEPTAIRLLKMPGSIRLQRPTMDILHKLIGVYRFRLAGNDPRLLNWPAIQRRSHISQPGAANMMRAGLEIGARPMDWYGVMRPVLLHDVLLEVWDGQAWRATEIGNELTRLADKLETVCSMSASLIGPELIKTAWQAPAVNQL